MKRAIVVCLLAIGLCAGGAWAQFGGIVYDPTNYHNAVLRYLQLQQQLVQLRNSYAQLVQQYRLAVQMAKNLRNMPARYQAQFSSWRNGISTNTYGNTAGWIAGVNSGALPTVDAGYRQATTPLGFYETDQLSAMNADELSRVKSQYASVELSDGANTTALAAIGAIRGNAQNLELRLANLEQDSLSPDADLNTELAVLNKINAANVLTLRTLQDSNKLLASLLEQQTIVAKQQRESTANGINTEIARKVAMAQNLSQVTTTLSDSLEQFRMP